MRIQELKSNGLGLCMNRISQAFQTHFPNVEWVNLNPDIRIIYVFGGGEVEMLDRIDDLSNVVIFQVNFNTINMPTTTYLPYWKRAKLVISFHPLDTYFPNEKFNFIRTALGAEPSLFPVSNVVRPHKVFTTGHVAETECIDLIYEACKRTGTRMLHTGHNFNWDTKHYWFLPYMEDGAFKNILSTSQYIAGLRLVEGFEMMCIEGAMTGAVPIIPDLPTYDFYRDFGTYINVDLNITQQLEEIFSMKYEPLSPVQVELVRDTFSWSYICKRLYDRISA